VKRHHEEQADAPCDHLLCLKHHSQPISRTFCQNKLVTVLFLTEGNYQNIEHYCIIVCTC